jgi:hypothetical protein
MMMRKELRYILPVLMLAVLFLMTAGCQSDGSDEGGTFVFYIDEGYTPATEIPEDEDDLAYGRFSSAEERLTTMKKVAEDSVLELWFDNKYMEIGVKDKASGEIWLSAPYNYRDDTAATTRASSDTKDIIGSMLRLTFFDSAHMERRMNSYRDAAIKGQFGTKQLEDGNGMSLQMLIGRLEESLLVPYAAEKEHFEEKVLNSPGISERERRRLLAWYQLYSWGDESMSAAVRRSMEERYSGLKERDLYIMRSANLRERKVLEEIIKKTEYTQEDLELDDRLSGFTAEEDTQALFKITLEFRLENGSLSVTMPADKIEYDTNEFTLSRIQLLEYFGAGNSANEGYLFIPDGSGALINFNTDRYKPLPMVIKPVYGDDVSQATVWLYTSVPEVAHMPVFGIKEGDRAIFAIIEDGEALADIVSQSGNFTHSFETVSATFYYSKNFLAIYDDGIKLGGNYRYFDRNFYTGDFKLRYGFLTGSEADYNGMARVYREYLTDRGILTPLAPANENVPLYLETLGKLEKRDTFMGIPYNRDVSLTSFSQAGDIMAELKSKGVENITLRYRGWFNGGMDYTVPSRISPEKALGGWRGLEELIRRADSDGFSVHFDVDFTCVRNLARFSGYNRNSDAPQSLTNRLVHTQPREMITNMLYVKWSYFTISPNKLDGYFDSFIGNVQKHNLGRHVSIASAGQLFLADYNRRRPVNLQQSRDIMARNLARLTETTGSKILVDGGHAFALEYADKLMNMPMSGSQFIVADESVPFMQLVLHGSVSYTGGANNMKGDPRIAMLKNAEYGANPTFTVAHSNISELKDNAYAFYYAVDYATWRDIIIDSYLEFNNAYRGLEGVYMTRHDRIEDGVFRTQYANGVSILVNYNSEAVTVSVDGRNEVVEGISFKRVG